MNTLSGDMSYGFGEYLHRCLLGNSDDMIYAKAMDIAIEISYCARGVSSPNPPVGAVVLDDQGYICGLGATNPAGGDHAEISALRQADERARRGLLVVTLEPCSHWGRTPPCTDTIIASGISTVVYAVSEPTSQAHGGAEILKSEGITVISGIGEKVASEGPLREWLYRIQFSRPYISAKIAMSLDGRINTGEGKSMWLTNEQSRAHAHMIRRQLDALIVGTKTCLIDNPQLTARDMQGCEYSYQPLRAVVGNTPIPKHYHICQRPDRTLFLPRLSPKEIIEQFPNALNILIEGGPTLLGSFFAENLIDRIYFYIAPVILAKGALAFHIEENTEPLCQSGFSIEDMQKLGDDTVLIYRRK